MSSLARLARRLSKHHDHDAPDAKRGVLSMVVKQPPSFFARQSMCTLALAPAQLMRKFIDKMVCRGQVHSFK